MNHQDLGSIIQESEKVNRETAALKAAGDGMACTYTLKIGANAFTTTLATVKQVIR